MIAKQPKQTSGGGWHIAPLGKPSGRNLIMKSVGEEFRQALNACGKMSIELTDQLTPSIQYSQDNIVFKIPRSAVQGSSSVDGLPFQIEAQAAANTVQVSNGSVFVSPFPRQGGAGTGNEYNGTNTGADITLSASLYYIFYLKCYYNGSSYVAEVNYFESADPVPTDWTTYPTPQHLDSYWPTPVDVGYVLIGYVDTATSPPTVTQSIFDNPNLFDFSLSGMVTSPSSALGNIDWDTLGVYRIDARVVHSGSEWQRYQTSNGDDGGEPGVGSNDWFALP